MRTIDPQVAKTLNPEQRGWLAAYLSDDNPLLRFHSCDRDCGHIGCVPRPRQHEFMVADNKIVAAFAGNRFGKTTANVVWAIVQHCGDHLLPNRLKVFKRSKSKVTVGRYLTKNLKTFETVVIPELRKWLPPEILKGGRWDKAYSKQHNIVYFEDGGRLEFYSYDQDAAGMVGASLDYVIYDEPPPLEHFNENWIRTTDRRGVHRFGLTPVNMQGSGIGWLSDQIFDAAMDGAPHITLIRGSIHDNPLLSKEEIALTLAQYPEDERQAREFGDIVHFGGMVYPGGFEGVLKPGPRPDELRHMDIVVGIDPGLKNAAFVWGAFDNDNRLFLFHEALVQEGTAVDYAQAIFEGNRRFGTQDPLYVIDPSARNRSLVNAESIEAELQRQGIFPIHGQNQVQAGVQQMRRRMQEQGLFVSEGCRGLRQEARKYRMEDRPDGEFAVVKEFDHHLDAARYLAMARPWYVIHEPTRDDFSWQPDFAPPADWLSSGPPESSPPLGAMS